MIFKLFWAKFEYKIPFVLYRLFLFMYFVIFNVLFTCNNQVSNYIGNNCELLLCDMYCADFEPM